MEVVHVRCAGVDIAKKDAKVCVRIAGAGRRRTAETVTTWGSMTGQVLALRDHLIDQQVTCVVMEALIAGQRDPAVLADLAKRRLRSKIGALTEALEGRFSDHHAFLARVHLDLIDRHTIVIAQLTDRIEVVIAPFRAFRDLVRTIPGIGVLTADVIVAETGVDMTRFPAAKHLASRAGTTPGNNESAGKVKSSRTRPGNPYLQGALGAAAMACSRSPGTYLGAKYRRVAARRGPQKANVAIQHAMLIAIWCMATNGTLYDDLGSDYYTRTNPDRARTRAVRQLEAMGYHVTLDTAS
jgi:transposase